MPANFDHRDARAYHLVVVPETATAAAHFFATYNVVVEGSIGAVRLRAVRMRVEGQFATHEERAEAAFKHHCALIDRAALMEMES